MERKYEKMKNLFLKQSYCDDWEEYQRSLRKDSFPKWDYVVLTASNEEQAEAYRQQIRYRIDNFMLPKKTKFIVLPDPQGKRVGSGGATLNVLRYIAERENQINCFEGKKILVIHSGGDSKRIPQYSACGKLFSPVPRELPDGRVSTLFDEFIISMSGLAGRIKSGMLVLSGDVLLLFNPLQIDYQSYDSAAISMIESVETGQHHGVFTVDEKGKVKRFLHKKSISELEELGAVDNQRCVHIDTGAIFLGAPILIKLLELIVTDNQIDGQKWDEFVNERARVSFYGDFIYPLSKDGTLEDYLEQETEGEKNKEILECRKKIWSALKDFNMAVICPSPAEFIHFGTTGELLDLLNEEIDNYECLGWKRQVFSYGEKSNEYAMNTAVVYDNSKVGVNAYLENCILQGKCKIGNNSILSGIEVSDIEIPNDTVVHCLRLKNGKYVVRIYGTHDNPKENLLTDGRLFGKNVGELLKKFREKIWDGDDTTLWRAKLYPECDSMQDAFQRSMLLYKELGKGKNEDINIEALLAGKRYSLYTSFNSADVKSSIEWKKKIENVVLTEKFVASITSGIYYEQALKIFGDIGINDKQYEILLEKAAKASLGEKIRIYYILSRYMKKNHLEFRHKGYDLLEDLCFSTISDALCKEENSSQKDVPFRIKKDMVDVKLPVRVNWGGGWTDTPPYCNENGGVVLNAAITLKGEYPIQVSLRKLDSPVVIFCSDDTEAFAEISDIEEIRRCKDPSDPVALHKASFLASGLIPLKGTKSLKEVLQELGGGIQLSTKVVNIPKGSGLGTSSILSIACIKGIFELLGEKKENCELYETVLRMEQLMSTGGGWQDQVGGLTPGVKYITTKPGIKQEIKVENVIIPDAAKKELNDRFALIYTGQRRLARNILRDVVGGYIGNRPETLQALERMKRVAVLMKFELEEGNIQQFAELLNEHWELSKQLDGGSTNSCIEQIFYTCSDLIDGRFIAGAGGGGFLQVILKKGVEVEQLKERLHRVFFSSGVDVWECELI